MQQNPGTMTGTPTLASSLLRTDPNQALTFDGSTNSMSVADSVSDSLTVADGGSGGAAVELWVKLPSLPAADKVILGKSGSYEIGITGTGSSPASRFYVKFTNGANNVTVNSNATAVINTTYHIVGVYNGDYTGSTIFGYQTQGASQFNLAGDYFQGSPSGATNNLIGSKFSILEKGQATSIVADLQRVHDATNDEWCAAALYKDSAGSPGALVAMSAPQKLTFTSRTWVTFPLSGALYTGDYWLMLVGGSESGQFKVGYETSGGSRKWRAAAVTDGTTFTMTGTVPDPFGTVVSSDSGKTSIYCNYTATGRTGDEGKALIYLNGVLDNSSAYAHGIADTSNNISVVPSIAATIDEVSIWNKKLTNVQVARHYASR